MNLEDQVCSVDHSKKLKELNVKQDSLLYWTYPIYQREDLKWRLAMKGGFSKKYHEHDAISAFTVSELGEILPDCIDYNKLLKNKNTTLLDLNGHFIKSSKKDDEYKIYIDGLTKCIIFFSKNEANARAKMLIYLIENELVKL